MWQGGNFSVLKVIKCIKCQNGRRKRYEDGKAYFGCLTKTIAYAAVEISLIFSWKLGKCNDLFAVYEFQADENTNIIYGKTWKCYLKISDVITFLFVTKNAKR